MLAIRKSGVVFGGVVNHDDAKAWHVVDATDIIQPQTKSLDALRFQMSFSAMGALFSCLCYLLLVPGEGALSPTGKEPLHGESPRSATLRNACHTYSSCRTVASQLSTQSNAGN